MSVPAEAFSDSREQNRIQSYPVSGAYGDRVVFHVATPTYPKKGVNDAVRDKFLGLAEQWRSETGHSSKMLHKFMNRNYQQIIGMSDDVIPVLLDELQTNPDHWFWALEMITGENPIKQEHAGYLDLMSNDWIEWGKEKGHISA